MCFVSPSCNPLLQKASPLTPALISTASAAYTPFLRRTKPEPRRHALPGAPPGPVHSFPFFCFLEEGGLGCPHPICLSCHKVQTLATSHPGKRDWSNAKLVLQPARASIGLIAAARWAPSALPALASCTPVQGPRPAAPPDHHKMPGNLRPVVDKIFDELVRGKADPDRGSDLSTEARSQPLDLTTT